MDPSTIRRRTELARRVGKVRHDRWAVGADSDRVASECRAVGVVWVVLLACVGVDLVVDVVEDALRASGGDALDIVEVRCIA